MYDELLKIAYDKSDEIVNALNCGEYAGIVDTQQIVDAVSQSVPCKIQVSSLSFRNLRKNSEAQMRTLVEKCGAMMLTTTENGNNVAHIVLNEDKPPEFQRFSLVHELGHLMTANSEEDIFGQNHESNYILSTHIDYEITSIPRKIYKDNEFLKKEQMANIFALRVLMPETAFYNELKKTGNIRDLAERFGLSEPAVISRIRLVN